MPMPKQAAASSILTAYDSFDYARSALRLGAVDYLLKPFHDGDLENAVRYAKQKLVQPSPSIILPGIKKIVKVNMYRKRLDI